MKSSKFLSAMEKTKRMGDISKQFTKCKEYGDDKVSLAMQVRGEDDESGRWLMFPAEKEVTTLQSCSSFSSPRRTNWWTNTFARWAHLVKFVYWRICWLLIQNCFPAFYCNPIYTFTAWCGFGSIRSRLDGAGAEGSATRARWWKGGPEEGWTKEDGEIGREEDQK